MRIGIDARMYGQQTRGIGRYIAELLHELEIIDTQNEYVIFLNALGYVEYQPQNSNFKKILVDIRWYGLKEQVILPFKLYQQKLDLMHFPHFNVPLLYRKPFIVTIHDLILLNHKTMRATTLPPILYNLKYFAYKLSIGNTLKRAKKIITVSQATSTAILTNFPQTDPNKISVTHLAIRPHTLTTEPKNRISNINQPFCFYVGGFFPHKNLNKLIEAFGIFKKTHPNYQLVLAGAEDYFSKRLKTETPANLLTSIIFLGPITEAELAEAYTRATMLVFPSLEEGFGLPPLEAASFDVPVVASDIAATKEVMGNAAVYFDPLDAWDMAVKMSLVADDKNLRESSIQKGRMISVKYSWLETATKTLRVYNDCLN